MNKYTPLITQTLDDGDFIWRCRICLEGFKTYTEAVEHLKTKHPYEISNLHFQENDKVWNPTRREE